MFYWYFVALHDDCRYVSYALSTDEHRFPIETCSGIVLFFSEIPEETFNKINLDK